MGWNQPHQCGLFQVFPGISSDSPLVYYSTILFVNIGIQSGLVTLLAAILATVFALGAVPLIWTIERINRRTIMGWGAVGLALTMMAFIGAFVQMVARPPLIKLRQCALVFPTRPPFHSGWPSASSLRSSSSSDTPGKALCALYKCCSNDLISLPQIWLVSVEIAPLDYRHIGASMATMGEWSASFWTVFGGQIAGSIPFSLAACYAHIGAQLRTSDGRHTSSFWSGMSSPSSLWSSLFRRRAAFPWRVSTETTRSPGKAHGVLAECDLLFARHGTDIEAIKRSRANDPADVMMADQKQLDAKHFN
jgi:hypothetical protein